MSIALKFGVSRLTDPQMLPIPVELHSHRPTRRQILRCAAGAGAVSSLSIMQSTSAIAAAALRNQGGASRVRSCVFVFYYGGPSHLDTYDMKPQAPSSVRGEFSGIETSVPGLQICEHMPHMAKVMHKVALVRSMHHTNRLHDSASTETHTGRQGAKRGPGRICSHRTVLSVSRSRAVYAVSWTIS